MARSTSTPQALERVLELLEPGRRPATAGLRDGYLDLLVGEDDPTGSLPGQRLMASRALPVIYERIWRPLGGRLLMGVLGPATSDERRIALEMLALSAGDCVLDLACGPGNFTRAFAAPVGEGLVVGVDASETMLARAAQETSAANVAYVRADAGALPFKDGSFDAVCCFAALYLIERPMDAIDEIARVLAPGGRVALLSSIHRGPLPVGATSPVIRGLTGVRMFGRDELTGALRRQGLSRVEQRVAGFGQFVSGRKPQ